MARALGVVLLVLGLLPVANWIDGGHDAAFFADRLDGWLSGGAIAVGVAIITVITTRRWPHLWREGAWQRIAARWRAAGWRADVPIAACSLALCIAIAHLVLSAKPLLIDELIQAFQARIFASGRLWLEAPPHPEFRSAQHLIDWTGKIFGQFPAGGPAFLALGTLVGAEWIVGPVATFACVLLFARLVRRIETRDGTALAAVLLFALSPFVLFLGGSMMNHVTTSMALLAAALALRVATGDAAAHPRAALLAGLALGIAATIRPLDAAVFAIPSGVWLAWRARRGTPHVKALLLSAVGIAVPMVALLWVNAAQTGDPFLFGYILMWGETHELGFHATPWGDQHTPVSGLELVNLYLLRLQTYLFESSAPSLLFATAALLLTRVTTAFDRWMIACSVLLLAAYFAYWHDGFYLGPRFMLPLAPLLVLWTARLPAVLREMPVGEPLRRGVLVAGCCALALGAATLLPLRALQYRNGMQSMRLDVEGAAASAGVRDALVLVRESWGSQVMVRLWAAGVSRANAEQVYRTADICRIEEALTRAEREGASGADVLAWLAPARADSARLVTLRLSLDLTPRVLPGTTLTPRCTRRVLEDRAGFTIFPPLLLARGNTYVRDLHARDSTLLADHPDREIWLMVQPGDSAPPVFLPVNRDSMWAEWRGD